MSGFGLALTLRLVFSLAVSRITVVWDAAAYWAEAQGIRASICHSLLYCPAGGGPHAGVGHTVDTVVFSKDGVLPLLQAIVLSVFPNTVTTVLVGFAVLDALACVMIAGVVVRLGGPLWAGVLAAAVEAVYVPGIIGDGSVLQQPLIRFGLVATVWSYAHAFTSDHRRHRFVVVGTVSLAVVGFTSESTRPMLWIVPTTVIALAASQPATRPVARMQLRASVIVAGGLLLTAVLIATLSSTHTFADALTNLGLGLSTSGTAVGQVTVLSFAHFWPSDAWPFFVDANATNSLAGDFARAPGSFIKLLAYSTYMNWRNPDYLYFQDFVLGARGQRLEHVSLIVPGFGGLAWLLGQMGSRRLVGAVVMLVTVVMSVIAGAVSVEPRRVGALMPLLVLGSACFAWSLARGRKWGVFELAGASALLFAVATWLSSLPTVLDLFPLSPGAGHWLLISARIVSAALVCIWVLLDWRRRWEGFSVAIPGLMGAALLMFVAVGEVMTSDWRAWTTTVRLPVRQEIAGLRTNPHLHPWLIADFATAKDAEAAEIRVNGRVVKARGVPMRRWQVDGSLLGWQPYSTLEQMTGGKVPHTWRALPLASPEVSGSRLTVEIRPPSGGTAISGDYVDADPREYVGPAMDPWFAGLSIWRWLWNARDPRIPMSHALDGRYSSSLLVDRAWRSGDLSTAFGRTSGRYRIYVTQQAFGPRTNVLVSPSPGGVPAARCKKGQLFPAVGRSAQAPYLCEEPHGRLAYYTAAGLRLGASRASAFGRAVLPGGVVDEVRSGLGEVEILEAGGPLFVANVYDVDRRLLYSLGFSYPKHPPTHL